MAISEEKLLVQLAEVLSSTQGKNIDLRISEKIFHVDSEIWQMRSYESETKKALEEVFYCEIPNNVTSESVNFWLWPDDPNLPQLKILGIKDSAEILLANFLPGFNLTNIQPVSYRPMKRALFRLDSSTESVWAKVVPQEKVKLIADKSEALNLAKLPTPKLLNWSKAGILVYESAPGTPANELKDHMEIEKTCASLLEFLNKLQDLPPITKAKSFPSSRLLKYEEMVRRFAPNLSKLIAENRHSLENELLRFDPFRRPMHIHGDLHLAQIFYEEDTSTAYLIDFDNLGLGDIHSEIGSLYASIWFLELFQESTIPSVWRRELRSLVTEFELHESLLKSEILAAFLTRISTLDSTFDKKHRQVADLFYQISLSPLG